MEEHEEVGHDVFYLVGNEYLAGIELDLVLLDLEVAFNLGEIEYTGEVERVVYVEVDPEEGVFGEGVELFVELEVVFVLEVVGVFVPEGCGVVDDALVGDGFVFGFSFLIHAIFLAVLLGAELDLYGQELAIFIEYAFETVFVEELFGVCIDVEDDVGAAGGFGGGGELKLGGAIAFPTRSFIFGGLEGTGDDLYTVGHHEGGIEAEAELADDVFGVGLVLEFFYELGGTGEGDLVDVLFDLFAGHADAFIADGDGLFVLIEAYLDAEVAELTVEFAEGGEFFELLGGIYGVADELAEEDLMIGV